MGSGYSKAVKAAFKHVMNGLSVPEAAKKAGCAKSTVYRYPPYQEHVKAKKQS